MPQSDTPHICLSFVDAVHMSITGSRKHSFRATCPGCVFTVTALTRWRVSPFFTHLVIFNKTYTRCSTGTTLIDIPTGGLNELWTLRSSFYLNPQFVMPFLTLNTLHESLMISQITGNVSLHFYNNSRNRVVGVSLSGVIKKSCKACTVNINNALVE